MSGCGLGDRCLLGATAFLACATAVICGISFGHRSCPDSGPYDLGATTKVDFVPGGLRLDMDLPLEHLADGEREKAAP